jgi:tRNA U34 5-methylaminomethyl-2-thiouridine-forming methyltransferase MnmC
MVETRLTWFGHIIRRVDYMSSQITKGRGRRRKTKRETIKKNLEINELNKYMVYDRSM